MDRAQVSKQDYSVTGWSLLLIWWGVVIIVDPLTVGMGALGTGVICLGVNAARRLSQTRTNGTTTTLGLIALLWGALDTVLKLRFEASLAALLVITGLVILVRGLLPDGPDEDADAE